MLLFRQQAVTHQQQKLHGTILLARPISFSVLTLLFALFAVAIVLFFLSFGYTRKEQVVGALVPKNGVIRIYPWQTAVVVARKVNDEQVVREGDPLFVLSSERSSSAKGDTQTLVSRALSSRIQRLRSELAQQQIQARQQRVSLEKRAAKLLGQLQQIDSEVVVQQKRVALAEAAAHRFDNLLKSNFVSEAHAQERMADVLDQQTRLRSLERTRTALNLDLATMESEISDQPLKAQREASAIERSIAELEQEVAESEAQRQVVILAPRSGVVTAITAEPGQTVPATQPLAVILPAGSELEAELYAPTRAVGFVKIGTVVLLRYQAFAYQHFGQYRGVVSEVSNTALQPSEVPTPLARDLNSTEPVYRIRVKLDSQSIRAYGGPVPLKSGMQLEASLLLEYRTLYEWAIEPLYGIAGRL
jgi:membrane fusion protein